MTDHPTLFDPPPGPRCRVVGCTEDRKRGSLWCEDHDRAASASHEAAAEAQARVEAHADPSFLIEAGEVVDVLAATGELFSTDDVWDRVTCEPHDRRAIGPVMRAKVRAGVIVATKDYRPSRRVEAHANPKMVYVGTARYRS